MVDAGDLLCSTCVRERVQGASERTAAAGGEGACRKLLKMLLLCGAACCCCCCCCVDGCEFDVEPGNWEPPPVLPCTRPQEFSRSCHQSRYNTQIAFNLTVSHAAWIKGHTCSAACYQTPQYLDLQASYVCSTQWGNKWHAPA